MLILTWRVIAPWQMRCSMRLKDMKLSFSPSFCRDIYVPFFRVVRKSEPMKRSGRHSFPSECPRVIEEPSLPAMPQRQKYAMLSKDAGGSQVTSIVVPFSLSALPSRWKLKAHERLRQSKTRLISSRLQNTDCCRFTQNARRLRNELALFWDYSAVRRWSRAGSLLAIRPCFRRCVVNATT